MLGDWYDEWQCEYEIRLKMMVKMRQINSFFLRVINECFLTEVCFTHPVQIRSFLRAYPPTHPLLSTVRLLRVDLPLGLNLPWADIPYTAMGWPHRRTYDIYWHPPPNQPSAHYGIVEVYRLYRTLLTRIPNTSSFDSGIHSGLGLASQPPPAGYLRTMLHVHTVHLTTLHITSPMYNSDLMASAPLLQHLQELVIQFLADRVPIHTNFEPRHHLTFNHLRRLYVSGHIGVQPLLWVKRWNLPVLEVLSCLPMQADPYLSELLQKSGKHLQRLVIRGKYQLREALALGSLCPTLDALEIGFTASTPLILSHGTVRTIVIHACDLLPLLTVDMVQFRAQMDVLVEPHGQWPRLAQIVDTSWPPRPFNYALAGYMTWWESPLRLHQLWEVGVSVLDAYGGEMRGEWDGQPESSLS
ncbi:hypothetical protein M422DRAFT_776011 [Sphaerobolus stellatus SS14]|nr:hypothetical protein M422DRAFT_776011 [Sphaerobolus stellatus SS14]